MAEWLERWTCNSEAPSSSITLTASWICSRPGHEFKSSAMLVNSQLVCLRPVGILKKIIKRQTDHADPYGKLMKKKTREDENNKLN